MRQREAHLGGVIKLAIPLMRQLHCKRKWRQMVLPAILLINDVLDGIIGYNKSSHKEKRKTKNEVNFNSIPYRDVKRMVKEVQSDGVQIIFYTPCISDGRTITTVHAIIKLDKATAYTKSGAFRSGIEKTIKECLPKDIFINRVTVKAIT
jgi:hypothetical protein